MMAQYTPQYHTNKYKEKHELVYYQLACTTLRNS